LGETIQKLRNGFLLFILLSAILFAGKITPAAERPELYLPLFKSRNVALVVNPSSLAGRTHLVDYLLKHGIKVLTAPK